MVAVADVGHHGHVAAVEGQPFAEDAAAGRFEHGRVDAADSSARRGALRAAAIAGVDAAVVDVDAVGAGHADRAMPPLRIWAMKRVVVVLPLTPVTATIGMRPFSPSGNSMSTIASPTGRETPADGSRCMRKPGAALTSTITPSCSSSGRLMSWATTSTPAMSRPTILRGVDRAGGHVGMDALGHVDGRAAGAQVRVAADQHDRAGRRNRIGREALIGQHGQRDGVELDLAQHRGVMLAAAGIGVDDVDQLADRVVAVADDVGRLAAGGGHDFAADDQHAVVVARGELLDQHGLAFLVRGLDRP